MCGSRYIHNPRPLTYVYGKSEHTYTTQCSRTRTPIYLLGMVSNSTSNYLNIFTIGTHRTLTFFLCSTAAAAASSVRLSFSHSIPIFSFRFYLYYIHSFIIHISLCLLYTNTNCSEKSFDQIWVLIVALQRINSSSHMQRQGKNASPLTEACKIETKSSRGM